MQIRFSELVRLCPLGDLHSALLDHPEDTIGCLTAAAMIVTAVNGVVNSHLRVRILDFEPLTAFKDIKSNFVGKLVAIKGTIIRVGGIKSQVLKMNFECELCGAVMQVVGALLCCVTADLHRRQVSASNALRKQQLSQSFFPSSSPNVGHAGLAGHQTAGGGRSGRIRCRADSAHAGSSSSGRPGGRRDSGRRCDCYRHRQGRYLHLAAL